MGMFDFAKKLIRRTYTEWGAEDGLRNFPSAGHGVCVPTYFDTPDPEPTATLIRMPQEQWKEVANG